MVAIRSTRLDCGAQGVTDTVSKDRLLGIRIFDISDIIEKHHLGWRIDHGDVAGAERVLRAILATPAEELQAMGQRAAAVVAEGLNTTHLLGQFCNVLQRGLPAPVAHQPGRRATAGP